ncbi:MAG: hypothetical protein ACRDTH_22055 [Pseudonocardiaceae bacterium]
MAKNAGQTVAALLAKAPPPPPRASASPAPALEPDPGEEDAREAESGAEAAPPATMVTATPTPRGQGRSPRPAKRSAPAEPTAPPTLRLSQPTAEALRTAWLEEKRSRVLLTYQDFAGEIITTGLRQARQHTPQQQQQ